MTKFNNYILNTLYGLESLWRSIKKFMKWTPVIWRDKDYDFTYFYSIMICKLETFSSYLKEKDRFESTPYKVNRIKTCIRLLKRAKKDYYNEEFMDLVSSNVDFIPLPDNPDLFTMGMKFEGDLTPYLNKYPLVCKKLLLKNPSLKENDLNLAIRVGYYNHERCRSLIFKILESDLETWWD